MSRRLVPAATPRRPARALALSAALLLSLLHAGSASASSPRPLDQFSPASTSRPTLRTDGERFAAWERPSGATVIFDARRPGLLRSVRTPAGARLAAVGGGRVIWELPPTGQPRPTTSTLVAADAAAGQPGAPVRFVATYGSGPLCPQAGAVYGGITDAGTTGAIVTCLTAVGGQPWRFSVDPLTGASTAPHYAPAELVGKVWAWNADAAGIQVLACDTVARAAVFADPAAADDTRELAYESPFGAGNRWDHARRTVRPGAQLVTCGSSRPVLLERTGSPSDWQFGGTELSWVTSRRGRRGARVDTINLYDLRRARMQRQVSVRMRQGTSIAAGHVAGRLLVQTSVQPRRARGSKGKARRATSTVRVYRGR